MTDTREAKIAAEKAIWRDQAGAIPGLLGGKSAHLALVRDLVTQIDQGRAIDLDARVDLSFDIVSLEPRVGGAPRSVKATTWRDYYGFLRGMGLALSSGHGLVLTELGTSVAKNPSTLIIARAFADQVRLFAEVLAIVGEEPRTVDQVHEIVQERYGQLWRSNANTRIRMDWQEVLGLLESAGNRQWRMTDDGIALLADRILVSPDALGSSELETSEIPDATPGIQSALDELATSNRTHSSRSTYNIWVPSPASSPNKVENLRTIVAASLDRIAKEDLFVFICDRFDLKRSSVDSMLPFLRSAGLIVEVSRGTFEATRVAREWIDSGDDLNFIRILHAHMRFVGEMIRTVESETTRSEVYAEAAKHGMNKDKCRWIAGFLMNTGLIEEPRYGSLRATARGRALLAQLPIALASEARVAASPDEPTAAVPAEPAREGLARELARLSKDPHADGMPSGRAFEAAVCRAFTNMGFAARVISGSGDTDVLVEWTNHDGDRQTAIVEAKARTGGSVAHTDVSDVAIETHKSRHDAVGVAVVGPAFSGQTLTAMAERKGWVLIEADRLGRIAEASVELGIQPCDIANLFATPNGITDLEDLIESRTRELEIITFLVAKLAEEGQDGGEPISARDVSRDGRRSDLAPSVDEVVAAVESLARLQVESPRLVEPAEDPRFAGYVLGDAATAARQLRAFAAAIERGLK